MHNTILLHFLLNILELFIVFFSTAITFFSIEIFCNYFIESSWIIFPSTLFLIQFLTLIMLGFQEILISIQIFRNKKKIF